MNTDNLHELIDRYEAKLDILYGTEHNERFKWRAMKTWRDEWFKPEESFTSFADRYSASKKNFSLFMDNSRMHPSSGVLKLWEKEPETVEHLFLDVLFADAQGSVSKTQNLMDAFLDGYEALRQKYFPRNWSYKQDPHSASVYLAMNAPDFNYVFKSSEARTMAKYVEFGSPIGSGMSFSLENYYRLCDEIVTVLREHTSLLEKHFNMLTEEYYVDKSLHLLAFDLMYCCRTYNYYRGLPLPHVTSGRKRTVPAAPSPEEAPRHEEERAAKIQQLQQEITELENGCDGCEDISLIGVQVSSGNYGTGTVIRQEINRIEVQFSDVKKTFILDKKYSARPRFEDDDEIVEAFTKYARIQDRIKELQKQIDRLQV